MTDMQPAEIQQIADVLAPVIENAITQAIAFNSEQVFTNIEELRQQVADAVQSVNDTAQVLYDNDTAIMARVMERDGNEVAAVMQQAGESWARFVRGEAEALGWKVMVPK